MKIKTIIFFIFIIYSPQIKAQFQFNNTQAFTSSIDYSLSVAYLKNGDKVVSGKVVDTVKLSNTVKLIKATEPIMYVARYHKNGDLLWYYLVKGSSSSSDIDPNAGIKTDVNSNIYVAGNFRGEIAFSSKTMENGGVLGSAFYLKLDSTGLFLHVGILGSAFCADFDITSDMRVVLGGNVSSNPRNAMVAKFQSNGQINAYEIKQFNGSKSNRDQITAVCVDQDNNIYFAGKCNGSSLSISGLNTVVKGPNNINNYTLFIGKISNTNWASWLKVAVPIPGSKPYTFDIAEMHYHKNHNAIIMAGFFDGSNFSLDGDTLAKTSTVNSDSRKPIIISVDSTGAYIFKTSLGLELENQRGQIFSLSLQDRNYTVSAEIENYENTELNIAKLNIKRGEKGLVIATIDSIGRIIGAVGTSPADKIDVIQVNSAAYNNNKYAITLTQNAHKKAQIDNTTFSIGTSLMFAINCGTGNLLISGNKKVCMGDSVKLVINSDLHNIEWYLNGIKKGQKTNELYVKDSSMVYAKAISSKGCSLASDTISVSFYRKPKAQILGIKNSYCINNEVVTISLKPAGGILQGTGILNNNFDAQLAGVGKHVLSYTYTNSYTCTAQTNFELEVFDLPKVEIIGLDSTFCNNQEEVNLVGNPANGTFTGIGVKNNKLKTSIGEIGKRNIIYSYTDNNACSNADTVQIEIFESTPISFSGLDTAYCPKDTFIILRANVQGGTFSGNGINDTVFNPFNAGAGKHVIKYTYTNSFACTSLLEKFTRVRTKSECEMSTKQIETPQLQVFPNPFSQVLNFNNTTGQTLHYQLFTQEGKLVYNKSSQDKTIKLDLNHLAKGVYTLKVSGNGLSETQHIIKK